MMEIVKTLSIARSGDQSRVFVGSIAMFSEILQTVLD